MDEPTVAELIEQAVEDYRRQTEHAAEQDHRDDAFGLWPR